MFSFDYCNQISRAQTDYMYFFFSDTIVSSVMKNAMVKVMSKDVMDFSTLAENFR
jgi:hypothetical protein